jgi:hypothetical protein
MAEDGIPEILAEQRLGHQVPGMRGLYAHASQQMREKLTAALQARWEESLRRPPPSTRTPRSRCSITCWRRSGPCQPVTPVRCQDRRAQRPAPRSQESVPQAGLPRWPRSQNSYLAHAPENACSQGSGRRRAP